MAEFRIELDGAASITVSSDGGAMIEHDRNAYSKPGARPFRRYVEIAGKPMGEPLPDPMLDTLDDLGLDPIGAFGAYQAWLDQDWKKRFSLGADNWSPEDWRHWTGREIPKYVDQVSDALAVFAYEGVDELFVYYDFEGVSPIVGDPFRDQWRESRIKDYRVDLGYPDNDLGALPDSHALAAAEIKYNEHARAQFLPLLEMTEALAPGRIRACVRGYGGWWGQGGALDKTRKANRETMWLTTATGVLMPSFYLVSNRDQVHDRARLDNSTAVESALADFAACKQIAQADSDRDVLLILLVSAYWQARTGEGLIPLGETFVPMLDQIAACEAVDGLVLWSDGGDNDGYLEALPEYAGAIADRFG